ncbi:bifunctional pyr operon transcriptional regulator/uracil phosphoribosyltransferase PyrR [Aquisalimonas sp. 2447]|uniref:bifunctional pyr operon transcriptional regulator/uracil phosphoribosyltransferase PyrR n=1 Tax=Aquisalimonas sp. 2447 TaxID=2740807 RepID=UPI0014326D05|nr:bifunctional pyr operon transcriptional regulator/uracil phosphoribosyltransferase PyrR [Aquisalimonas sp. 2447]QIT54189.1 bifunctional pyr operon transcriptional regulator/uracil phosphoribosyltransferase PyrR [Aquisalimonas sp. 2447]
MTELAPVSTLISRMADDLRALLAAREIHDPAMIGIHSGGAWVARELHSRLGLQTPLGTLDIAFYRDDVGTRGVHPQVRPSNLPFAVDDRDILLVDDVLYSGRTVRAAMNEIFDFGRPRQVLLAVLVDRGERELPVAADVVGTRITLADGQRVKLRGPDPMELTIQDMA